MISKYRIDYGIPFHRRVESLHYQTDDPVACEQFLVELLDRGYQIRDIKHEGVSLPRTDFDQMVKTAAGALASQRIGQALSLKPEEVHFRFGYAA